MHMEDTPLVFDHIAHDGEKGRIIPLDEFVIFVSSVATRLLGEKGVIISSSVRLLSSNLPCLISDRNIYLVPFSMFPDYAKARKEDIEEIKSVARAIGRNPLLFPLSFASLSDNPSEMVAGGSYLVRDGEVEEII